MRINLSIADDLKRRMDAIPNINWSAVAASAFRVIVTNQEVEMDNIESIVERLKASRQSHEAELKARAQYSGREWAAKIAEYRDLLAMQKSIELDGRACAPYTDLRAFMTDLGYDADDFDRFDWEDFLDDQECVEAFCDAAIGVLEEARAAGL